MMVRRYKLSRPKGHRWFGDVEMPEEEVHVVASLKAFWKDPEACDCFLVISLQPKEGSK